MFKFEYIGNLHIHSLHSDGGSSTSQIVKSAARAGLDFICLNDHDIMTDTLHLNEEGFYGKVLTLVGLEIGGRYHHYLAYDIKEMIRSKGLGPQEVITLVNEQGGFGFLAHPFEKGMPFREGSIAYTWNDLSVTGYAGICIWNFMSRWKEGIMTFFNGIFALAFKKQSLKPPSRKTLAFWDQACQQRRVVAIGGSDAHGSLFTMGRLSFRPLSYDYLMNTVNIHILLHKKLSEDFERAKQEVYGAMKEGRLFIAHDRLYPARGFRFRFISNNGPDIFMGEEGDFRSGELVIELPRSGEVRIIKDGRPLKTYRGTGAVYKVSERGVYRVEVYRFLPLLGWRPWIFSNPIYLR